MSTKEDRDAFYERFNKFQRENCPAHRNGKLGLDWHASQSMGDAKYSEGDVVEFMEGGYGIIEKVSDGRQSGWPVTYSTRPVPTLPFHPKGIYAWHCCGDIKGKKGFTITLVDLP